MLDSSFRWNDIVGGNGIGSVQDCRWVEIGTTRAAGSRRCAPRDDIRGGNEVVGLRRRIKLVAMTCVAGMRSLMTLILLGSRSTMVA